MNLNGIINMVTRMLTRRATHWGMKAMDRRLSGNGKKGAAGAPGRGEELSPAARRARDDVRAAAKRARQAARITRKLR